LAKVFCCMLWIPDILDTSRGSLHLHIPNMKRCNPNQLTQAVKRVWFNKASCLYRINH
jgi:hypothetical protein